MCNLMDEGASLNDVDDEFSEEEYSFSESEKFDVYGPVQQFESNDAQSNEFGHKNEPNFTKPESSFAFGSYDENENEKNDCFDGVDENPQPVYHKWKKFMWFKPKIPVTPLYNSKPMISKHYKKDSEVKIGNTFNNKEALDLAVRLKALKEGYQFLSKKTNLDRYEQKCYHFKECAWSIHAKRWGNTDKFQITRMNDVHTCPKTQTYPNHRNANKKVIAHILNPKLKDNRRVLKGKDIQKDILSQYKTSISYQQAWRGKEYGLEQIRGSPYESFEMLPYYLHNLERKNKGTVTRIKTDEGVFEMLFIALGASIRTFVNHLRPLLIIDAAHLKGQYKGTNLVAVGMDGNNQIVPIAFGICKGETGPCWSWWMSVLKECIGDNPNLLFISDRHASIALAVRNEFPLAFHAQKNLEATWTYSKQFSLMRITSLWKSVLKDGQEPIAHLYASHHLGILPSKMVEGFNDFVTSTWNSAPSVDSNGMRNLAGKLKFLKAHIKIWIKDNKSETVSTIANLKKELNQLDAVIDKGTGTEVEAEKRMEVLAALRNIDHIHSMDLAQKAKIKWSIEGDENSNFFHGILNKKRNQMNIRGITIDGVWKEQPNDVKQEFLSHFQDRFAKPSERRANIDMRFPKTISEDQSQDLEREVSKQEIKTAVWGCGTDKSPGPDGFSFGFYRHFWPVIEHDVYMAVNHFFIHGEIPPGCNSSFIALIPKVPDANLVKDFRPISLIGSIYKIIAKILSNRLVNVLGDIVNEVQSAFIAERQMLDDPFILNEILQWCTKKKKKTPILRVLFLSMDVLTMSHFLKGWKQAIFIPSPLDSTGSGVTVIQSMAAQKLDVSVRSFSLFTCLFSKFLQRLLHILGLLEVISSNGHDPGSNKFQDGDTEFGYAPFRRFPTRGVSRQNHSDSLVKWFVLSLRTSAEDGIGY
ncbi:transposase, MuDR, MULE transposase domain protein [Tanacetum coccineum]